MGVEQMKHYENLEQAMCKELEMLDKKYAGDLGEMTTADVEKADVLYHALKSAATYHAMKDAEDWDEEESRNERRNYGRSGERSGRRGRDGMSRYESRDMEYSGRYPEWMPPYYGGRY